MLHWLNNGSKVVFTTHSEEIYDLKKMIKLWKWIA
jgi:hypothetical protein